MEVAEFVWRSCLGESPCELGEFFMEVVSCMGNLPSLVWRYLSFVRRGFWGFDEQANKTLIPSDGEGRMCCPISSVIQRVDNLENSTVMMALISGLQGSQYASSLVRHLVNTLAEAMM